MLFNSVRVEAGEEATEGNFEARKWWFVRFKKLSLPHKSIR